MNGVPQGTYWHVGEGEWRFQLSFCSSQAKIIDNYEVFILDLKQTDEISIEEA